MGKNQTTLNFIDVFAGAGGLSCGLEMAGLSCLLGIDNHRHAMETFAYNHRHAKALHCKVENLRKDELDKILDNRRIHLVVGGPPCQGFSTVGKGDPADKRNLLFLQFVEIVRQTKPYFIIMENVTGLVAKKNEKALKKVFNLFHNLGFNLDVKVLSAHHFGVPEKRRRTIIMGTRITDRPLFPPPTHDVTIDGKYIPPSTVGEAFFDLADESGKTFNHDVEKAAIKSNIDRRRLKRIPEGQGIRYERDEKAYLTPSLYLGVDWDTLPENRLRQTQYQRLDRKKPGHTITTSYFGYYHPTEVRRLTAREAAKIQSFSNDFKFFGTYCSQWRQIGNAVPPLLGKALGEAVLEMYRQAKKKHTRQKKTNAVNHLIRKVRSNAFIYKEKSF